MATILDEKDKDKGEKGKELKVTLVFSSKTAKLIRQQSKASYLPITQFLKSIVLRQIDTATL